MLKVFCSQNCVLAFQTSLKAAQTAACASNVPVIKLDALTADRPVTVQIPSNGQHHGQPPSGSNLISRSNTAGNIVTNPPATTNGPQTPQPPDNGRYNFRRRDPEKSFQEFDEDLEDDDDDYIEEVPVTQQSLEVQKLQPNPNLSASLRTYSSIKPSANHSNSQNNISGTTGGNISSSVSSRAEFRDQFKVQPENVTMTNSRRETSAANLMQSLASKAAANGLTVTTVPLHSYTRKPSTPPSTLTVTPVTSQKAHSTSHLQPAPVLLKEKSPTTMSNAGVQVRMSYVTKSVMCKPALVDAACQTD